MPRPSEHRISLRSPVTRFRLTLDLPGLSRELALGLDPVTLVALAAHWLDIDDAILAREQEASHVQLSQAPH